MPELSRIPSAFGFKPITVVAKATGESELPALFTSWMKTDDVFQTGFTQSIFLKGLGIFGARQMTVLGIYSTVLPLLEPNLPSGPYFVDAEAGAAYKTYRLYEDSAQAFTQPLLQKPDGSFQPLSAQVGVREP
jgi:hypothetical protein